MNAKESYKKKIYQKYILPSQDSSLFPGYLIGGRNNHKLNLLKRETSEVNTRNIQNPTLVKFNGHTVSIYSSYPPLVSFSSQ